VLVRLQAIARRDPEYKVGVAAGVWLDDLAAIESEAVTAVLRDLRREVGGLAPVRLSDALHEQQTGERRPDDTVYRYEVLALIDEAIGKAG
jgi:hypothetical protein